MAQIDLKNCTIIVRDGYSAGGGWLINHAPLAGFLVNNAAGYTTSDTIILVDGGTGILVTGTAIKFNSETGQPTHLITSHIETLGNTTSITISPALVSAVPDDDPITVMSAYPASTTTVACDGGAAALANGDQFTIAGETLDSHGFLPVHVVSSHSETLGVTTSVTFTPATNKWVADDAVVTVLPHFVQAHIGEGNLTYSEKRKIKYVTDRGLLDTVKEEDQQPVDVKLDYEWDFLTASSPELIPTVEDAYKRQGFAADWVSTSPDLCEMYCVDIVLTNLPPCPGIYSEVIVLPMFRWEDLAHDPKTSSVAVTGKCNVIRAQVSRVAP